MVNNFNAFETMMCSDARRPRTLGNDGANTWLTALSNDQEIKVRRDFLVVPS